MPNDLQTLASDIGKAPLKAKVSAGLAVLAVIGVLAIAGVVASKPHFVTLYSGLGDEERVAVEKALAGAKVSYRASQPPGPYVIYVDQSAYDEAQIAVALAEGLRHTPSGITTGEGGASAIFMSNGERQQSMLKREWEETEHLLQQLDFVKRATVTTSMPDNSPLRKKLPVSVSVALTLDMAGSLRPDEADAVAKLVRYRFGVPPENVIISDQSGNILYDPSGDLGGTDSRNMMSHSADYDRDLASKVNASLAMAFGERRALVTVNSEWDHDQSTTVAEAFDPETITVSSEKRSTKTPLSEVSTVGGIPGTSSNMAAGDGFGTDNAATGSAGKSSDETLLSETSDEKSTFDAARSRTQTVRTAPRLKRLSVSLVVDDSLAEKREEIIGLVKAAVGFDSGRDDVIGVSTTTFAVEEVPEGEEGEAAAEVAPGPPNPTMELLLTRGVEIVAALAFVIVLLKSLKGSKPSASTADVGRGDQADGKDPLEADPALVARAQIDELVRSNPRRVGEILSRWASEETAGAR